MPGGRPTEYNQDVIDSAWEYVNGGWKDGGSPIPSLVGMCRVLNRGKSTIYDWVKDPDKEFSDIVSALNERQEEILVSNGLLNEFQASVTKLLLTKHGYSDRVEQNTTAVVKVTGEMSDEELERIANGN